ncbi:hypothetical protein PV327_009330 [Microctonus hyperodae]|uniref:DOMON domain-containing protein n=1 Tax=Microctonus hyperodae TaxID=165561 RepID=A0AA39FTJ7_MICHY|nr:hypothetical protein PV327_009330 [Microctonus hyperodae]
MQVWIYFTLFLVVQGDLLDLYVQHMDETSGTNTIQKTHPRDIGFKLRTKRSPKESQFTFGPFKKQRLDVENDWWMDRKGIKKPTARLPILKPDGLAFPNMIDRTNDSQSYEIVLNKSEIKNEYKDVNFDVEIINDIQNHTLTDVIKKNPNRTPKKYHSYENYEKSQKIPKKFTKNESTEYYRQKRSIVNVNFTRHEILDINGHVLLEWDPSDDQIVTFRVTAKTLGYIGIGFNENNHMKGADIIIAWVDDHSGEVNLLDSHGDEETNASPITDLSQDVKILEGVQNDTHTIVTFSRSWQTCDPDDLEKENEALVHHMILYECASTSKVLGQHARIFGAPCYSVTMPREWDSCIQPIVAWARGSRGEWLGDHVGIPVAEHREGSYYMLEVHYNNPMLTKAIDSSGVRLHLTPVLRPQDAGIFVTGVAVSPLHLIPPQQKAYSTAGYCTTDCTDMLFPEDGVNVVSVLLHSHLAGRRISLKHIRDGKELPNIVHENHFDFDYQQSHSLENEVKILPGDELITECVYGTQDRKRPTLGGYAASQEMCLAFVVYYPRTELAGCYSMTPAKDLFKTLGVVNFKGVTLDNLEKLFLTTGTDAVTLPTTVQHQFPVYPATRPSENIDGDVIKEAESALKAMREIPEQENEDNVFARLIIEDPEEFRGRTLAEHILALPWTEALLTKSIEHNLYYGKHMTFCRKRDDKLALPANIQILPNFTKLPEKNVTLCRDRMSFSAAINLYPNLFIFIYVVVSSVFIC